MKIRLVTPEDLGLLCDLAELTFRSAWQQQNETVEFENYCRLAFSTQTMKEEMAQPNSLFYFAEADGDLLAYLKMNYHSLPDGWQEGSASQLERIYVAPNFLGQGLGSQLLRFCETESVKQGSEWLWLSVWKESPRSIAFYEQNGYSKFGTKTFWMDDDPQEDWLVRKKLV